MNPEKTALRNDEIDAQSALELPERELLTLFAINVDIAAITQVANVTQANLNSGAALQVNALQLTQSALARA